MRETFRPVDPNLTYSIVSSDQIFSENAYSLLMTDDSMRHIRPFQVGDLILGRVHGQSADSLFQVRDLGCPE
jgi:hypothetical protein